MRGRVGASAGTPDVMDPALQSAYVQGGFGLLLVALLVAAVVRLWLSGVAKDAALAASNAAHLETLKTAIPSVEAQRDVLRALTDRRLR